MARIDELRKRKERLAEASQALAAYSDTVALRLAEDTNASPSDPGVPPLKASLKLKLTSFRHVLWVIQAAQPLLELELNKTTGEFLDCVKDIEVKVGETLCQKCFATIGAAKLKCGKCGWSQSGSV